MRLRRSVCAVAVMAAVVAVAGCGGGSGGPASPSSSTSMTSTATPSPTSSSPTPSTSSTSTGTAAGAPGVPEAARQHTEAGAIAFSRHYADLINKTGSQPEIGVLEPLALDSCKTCRNYAGNVKYLKKNGLRNSAAAATIRSSYRVIGMPGMVVEVVVNQNKIDVIDAKGVAFRHYPFVANAGLVFDLQWTARGWRVITIKIDSNASDAG